MLDFPDQLACIIWFAGCNMRCPYCYNPDLVNGTGKLTEAELFTFLNKRKGMLDGVVLSGGECTLYPNLYQLCHKVKEIGYLIKIDTNGSNPTLIKQLLDEKLVDYIALDFKSTETKYTDISKLSHGYIRFEETLRLLINSDCDFEVRTTIHPDLLNVNDINKMANYLKQENYQGIYYLQHFLDADATVGDIEAPKTIFEKDLLSNVVPIILRNF